MISVALQHLLNTLPLSSLPWPPFLAAPALNEELEFAAIQAIHGQLDDNADGSVDLSESSEVCAHIAFTSTVVMKCPM